MENKSSEAMDRFIRGELLLEQSSGQNGITPEQAERIMRYVEIGATCREAYDLVLGYRPEDKNKVPPVNAGAGTGAALPAQMDMNDFIRRKAAGY